MNGLSHNGSQYTDEDRRHVLSQYIVLGSTTRVAEITGIPYATIATWKNSADWWEEELNKIRQEKGEELDAMYTNAIHKAQNQVIDRIEHGDYILDKQNQLVRKPMNGKDLAMVGAIQFDKRQIMRNLPTSISAKADSQLESMLKQFRDMAQAKVIDGQVVKSEQTITKSSDSDPV